jgi:hypothetical protein
VLSARLREIYALGVIQALVPMIVFAALLGLILAAVRQAPPAVSAADDELCIRMGVGNALLALRRELRIPLSAVRNLEVAPARSVPRTGLRLPGASIPGIIRAGSYGTGVKRDFWLVRRAEQVLVLDLEPGQPYRRVVLQVADPERTAAELRPKIGSVVGR